MPYDCYRPSVLKLPNRADLMNQLALKTLAHMRSDAPFYDQKSIFTTADHMLRQERYSELKAIVRQLDQLDAIENCKDRCEMGGYAVEPRFNSAGVPCLCPAGKMRIERGEVA